MKYFQNISILIAVSFSFFSWTCSTSSDNTNQTKEKIFKDTSIHSSPYLQTGFYYLSTKTEGGIEIKQDHSEEEYILNSTPFTSIQNIASARLERVKSPDGEGTNLCLSFNDEGQKELNNGTAKALNQQIGIVVAGHLLYVVPVSQPITDSVMCVALIDYTEDEMQNMCNKVNAKE